MSKKSSRSSRITGSIFEKLLAIGAVFMLTPYLQAQLAPLRQKLYGPKPEPSPTPPKNYVPNVQSGTVPLPDVAPSGGPVSTIGESPNTVLNITPGLAPTGDTPAPNSGQPQWGAQAGPLGGLFLGS